MKAQHNIKAQKTTLFLMLLVTCLAAFVAAKMTATAQAATTHTAATATPVRVFPPDGDTGSYEGVQPPPKVIRDTIVRLRLVSVNKTGVAAKSSTFAQVDESAHVVSPKGTRVGGMYQDS